MLSSRQFFYYGILLTGFWFISIWENRKPKAPPKKWKLDSSTKGTIVAVEERIVKTRHVKRESYYHTPTIKYYVNGKEYVSEKQVNPGREFEWIYAKYGDIVDVWYDSNNPERFWAFTSKEIRERESYYSKIISRYIGPYSFLVGAIIMFLCAALGPDKIFPMFYK